MTMIRGKVMSEREVIPQEVTIGEPIFVQRDDKWYKSDGTPVQVESKSLSEVLSDLEVLAETG